MAGSVNVVVLVGNLTRDPELRAMPSGTSVCRLGLAVNERTKDPTTGEWGERPNYFDIDVFGAQGENCAQYLSKGRQVAVEGRLRWRSWETQEGQKRSAVSVVASSVQFIGPRDAGDQPARDRGGAAFNGPGASQPPSGDFAESGDDDIPF
ncbi:MAG: single-stranded DNA-binding protein [Actinobacteria bacterium]|nr:single-stranded DNA-binding protein [Actinomycetota bacterium]